MVNLFLSILYFGQFDSKNNLFFTFIDFLSPAVSRGLVHIFTFLTEASLSGACLLIALRSFMNLLALKLE